MDNNNRILNKEGVTNSLQISNLGNIPSGTFKSDQYFLIKNITDNNIKINVKLVNSNSYIETILSSGWNPELCVAVDGVVVNTLQYGY